MTPSCKQCGTDFEIFPEDREFYRTMDVPPPTRCYFCRMIRRFAQRNERHLYHRKCSRTGKQIISAFSADKPFPVYALDVWWSDAWDPLSYGQPYDFSRPFFAQFKELRDRVPRLALQQQLPMENSEYCHCASRMKNCYLVSAGNRDEECYYGSWVNDSRHCVDTLNIDECELCYECVSCRACYNLRWSRDCHNCRDSFFLRHCTGCRNCFGGSNLVNKQYVVFNEQKTKEQYEAFLREFSTGKHSVIGRIKEKVDGVLHDLIVKEYHGTNVERCVGDYLRDCKNAFLSFECDRCEDVRYCMSIYDARDCMDHSFWGGRAERTYECQACGYDLSNLRFCNLCWTNCSDLTYCDHCFSSGDCFGCVGLRKGKYCILNKQYTKEEYQKLVPQIIEHMKETGEFGEFFPIELSPYAYNESIAQDHQPLTKEEATRLRYPWHDDEDERTGNYLGPTVGLPDDIRDVPDTICTQILRCEVTGKPYKIIPQELQYYRDWNIPLPRTCPEQHHTERLPFRNPRKLWDRECQKCGKEMQTTYSPERKEIVYCESCYLQEVY